MLQLSDAIFFNETGKTKSIYLPTRRLFFIFIFFKNANSCHM